LVCQGCVDFFASETLTAFIFERMELPQTQALPDVTGRSAVNMRNVVVLPKGEQRETSSPRHHRKTIRPSTSFYDLTCAIDAQQTKALAAPHRKGEPEELST
jgi:hypothetical protein